MIDKMDAFDTQCEVSLLIDALPITERRQVMAALAEHYGFKLTDKVTASGSGFRPYPKRKTKPI